MKIFIVTIIMLFCICTLTNAQYQVYQIDLKGNAKATINGQSDYTATCNFGTMPAGYISGASGIVTIPRQ